MNLSRIIIPLFLITTSGKLVSDTHALGDADPSVEVPVKEVQVSVYGWPYKGAIHADTRIPRVPPLFYTSPAGLENLQVKRNVTTGPFSFVIAPDVNEIELFEKEERIDPATGEVTDSLISRIRASFPEDWNHLLLVVFPDNFNGKTYKAITMDTSPEAVPEGVVRMVNGSQSPLAIMAGGSINMIEPSSSIIFRPELDPSGKRFRVIMKRKDGEAWNTIYSSNASFADDQANLMVIYPTSSRRVQIMNFGKIR